MVATECFENSANFNWLGEGGPSAKSWLANWHRYAIGRDRVVVRRLIDPHAHLRGWKDLNRKERRRFRAAVLAHAPWASHVLAMPNTTPKILTGKDAREYAEAVHRILRWGRVEKAYELIPCLYLTRHTTPEMIYNAFIAGVKAAKLYPEGVTTGSDEGVSDIRELFPVFDAMNVCGMRLCVHGETVERSISKLKAERVFALREMTSIADAFPQLTIIFEHITTREAVEFVERRGNVYATITLHHLFLVHQDVIHDRVHPDHFCLPIAKDFEDRHALLMAAVSAGPKFMLGTDSAPHLAGTKYCASGCAGVFTGTVTPQLLVELFVKMGRFEEAFDIFTVQNAARVWGLTPSEQTITLVRRDNVVPASYEGIVPFWNDQTLAFDYAT